MARLCGTGLFDRPPADDDPPGHPGAEIWAIGVPTGINVWWNYPDINAHTVAYFTLYRGLSADFTTASYLATVGASFYADLDTGLDYETRFYYWVQYTTINGTKGPLVGPADATMRRRIQDIIDELVNQINESMLTQNLRSEIGRITDLDSSLSIERQERLFGDDILTDLWAQLEIDLGEIGTFIGQTQLEFTNENAALAASLNFMIAKYNENAAAIAEEKVAFATAVRAVATSVETLEATIFSNDPGSIQTVLVQTSSTAIAARDWIDENGEEIEKLYGEWTVKIQINNRGKRYIAGIGLAVDGVSGASEFTIIADRFAVVDPQLGPDGGNIVPFVIGKVDGETNIVLNARALIPDATIGIGMIENSLQSDNFRMGESGWAIFKDFGAIYDNDGQKIQNGFGPYAEFHNITARGTIRANEIEANAVNIIDTLHIRGEAVTVPAAWSGGSAAALQTGWRDLGYVNLRSGDYPPSSVIVTATMDIDATDGGNDTRTVSLGIRTSDGREMSTSTNITQGRDGQLHFTAILRDLPTGTTTFWILGMASVANKWNATRRSISVIGARR